jgi:RHS repeat-associated protein
MVVALVTMLSVAIALPSVPARAATPIAHKIPAVPKAARHTRIIGKIVTPKGGRPSTTKPLACPGGALPTPPAPAVNTLAFVSESTLNQVEEINETTGALIGSPIPVGTTPEGLAYWRPPVGSHMDPRVVVADEGNNKVSIIDAITDSVVATISLPSSAEPEYVSTSPNGNYAVVVDEGLGEVSIINLLNNTDAGQITLGSSAGYLLYTSFNASGSYAYVTDTHNHDIFVLEYTGGSAPYFTDETTYNNSSYSFDGIATDQSTTSSTSLYVTSATSGGKLLKFNDSSGTLAAPSVVTTFSAGVPRQLMVSPGSTYAYAVRGGTNTYFDVTLSSGSYTNPGVSGVTSLGPVGLSADGSTLLTSDTATATVDELTPSSGSELNSTSTAGIVSGLATALPTEGAWNAYVADGTDVDVVNTGVGGIQQKIPDSDGAEQVAVSPDGQFVYVSNSDYTITIIATEYVGTSTNPVVDTIPDVQGSEPNLPYLSTLEVSPSGDSLIVLDASNGAAYVIDTNPADGSDYRKLVNRIGLTGSGISSSLDPQDVAFSPDGLYAYVTSYGSDALTLLALSSATTTGYYYDTVQSTLSWSGNDIVDPGEIAISPNDEYVYIAGTDSAEDPTGGLWTFPIDTNGQLGNATTEPVWTGINPYGVAFSPEDDSAFITNTTSWDYSSVSVTGNYTAYTSSTTGWSSLDAVSSDGLYVGVLTVNIPACEGDGGSSTLALFDAGSGSSIETVGFSTNPTGLAFAPQSSPQTITTSELAGGATNEAEAAVTDGMNDVVSAGTPTDAPGASAGVDTATGNYSLSINSMTIPDIGPSLDATANYDSSRVSDNNLLGYGWDYTYGMTASQNGTSCVITVTLGTGATVTFSPTTSSGACSSRTYVPPPWAQAKLTTSADCNGIDSCWVITIATDTEYSIDETTGQLVKIADLNGNAVTITWGSHTACSSATSTEPCQVTAADGIRTLTFSYPSAGSGTCPSGSYTCVVITDPLGRTVTYVKNSSGQLYEISLANGSETATYAFQYYGGSAPNFITYWWDPQNEAADAGNDSFATALSWVSSRVTQVTGPEIFSALPLSTTPITPTTKFVYEDVDTSSGNGAVLIQNPDFNQSVTEAGASQTLDTYAGFQLVSSVEGYGPLGDYVSGSTQPVVPINPSESAYPMRDAYNLMPDESMNALAGTTESAIGCAGTHCATNGSQSATYNDGVVFTTYDAYGNVLETEDELGDTTSNSYNGLNESVTATDALGHLTTNTYNATGQLLTTTSPATNSGGTDPEISNWYNSNGTICASRDADQTSAYGALSSCVSAGSNAMTYSYDSSGDTTLTTATDSATQISTTQNAYDADGNVCATLSPDGYALGDRQTSCPALEEPYESVTVSRDVYSNPLESTSSLSVSPSDTYATTYACTNYNGDPTASVGPMGSSPDCATLSSDYTSDVDTTFTLYDADGDTVQTISPFAAAATTQGPTTTSQFDADGTNVLSLSADGYVAYLDDLSLTPYETGTLTDDQGNTVASAPQTDLTSTCEGDISTDLTDVTSGGSPSTVCPDTSVTAYDNEGQQLGQVSSDSAADSSPNVGDSTNNVNGNVGGSLAQTGTGTQETSFDAFDANGNALGSVNEHWTGSAWVTDSSSSTAYAPDGTACWTAPTTVSSPSCGSPPSGSATVSYYDLDGNLMAQVGPGGASTVVPGGDCNPETAVTTLYSINTSELCPYTTYYSYNEAGKMTKEIEPSLANPTTPSIGVTAGITTTYSYDASGNGTSEVNPAGNTVTQTFDGSNRLIGISYSDEGDTDCSAGGSYQETCYSFNADGTRSQMVDSTGTTSYSYNDSGQLTSVLDSNGNTVTYGYDQYGQENCISYPGTTTADECLAGDNPNNGTNSIAPGEVWYSYDQQGRMQTVEDWNGDAWTYGYDCSGDVLWTAETPSSSIPSITQCSGSSGTPPSPPSTAPSGDKDVITVDAYSNGASGGVLQAETTYALDSSGTKTELLSFGSTTSSPLGYNNPLTYDDNNDLMTSTPYVNGTAEATDTYATTSTPYDNQQRVPLSPEPSGYSTAYDYVNSSSSSFSSQPTVDGMGIDTQPAASSTYNGLEYAGSGELCWIAQAPTANSSNTCGPPSSPSSYESVSYNSSGDMTGTAAHGFGTNIAMTWNADTSEPTCINPSGSTCTGPSSSQPSDLTATYNGDGLRTTAVTWSSSTNSTVTANMAWNTNSSGLLSNGSFDFLYGLNATVPLAQVDVGDSYTSELVVDASSNVRGIVEVSSGAANPYVLANYTDDDVYGNPITASGGAPNPGGLTNEGESSDPDSSTDFGFGGGYVDSTGFLYLVNRYFDASLGQFISVDGMLAGTGTAYSYASDNPADATDALGLYNCKDKSSKFKVTTYQAAHGAYVLLCGESNKSTGRSHGGYGVNHIQDDWVGDKYGDTWHHFGGVLSTINWNVLMRVTLSQGEREATPHYSNEGNGQTVGYDLNWLAYGSCLPEPEVFPMKVVVSTTYGRVVTAYSPNDSSLTKNSVVDTNLLDEHHFAGLDCSQDIFNFKIVLPVPDP